VERRKSGASLVLLNFWRIERSDVNDSFIFIRFENFLGEIIFSEKLNFFLEKMSRKFFHKKSDLKIVEKNSDKLQLNLEDSGPCKKKNYLNFLKIQQNSFRFFFFFNGICKNFPPQFLRRVLFEKDEFCEKFDRFEETSKKSFKGINFLRLGSYRENL